MVRGWDSSTGLPVHVSEFQAEVVTERDSVFSEDVPLILVPAESLRSLDFDYYNVGKARLLGRVIPLTCRLATHFADYRW